MILRDTTVPTLLIFQRNKVQSLRNHIGHTLQIAFNCTGNKCPRNRSLLKDMTWVMRWKRIQNTPQLARFIYNTDQILTGHFGPVT